MRKAMVLNFGGVEREVMFEKFLGEFFFFVVGGSLGTIAHVWSDVGGTVRKCPQRTAVT